MLSIRKKTLCSEPDIGQMVVFGSTCKLLRFGRRFIQKNLAIMGEKSAHKKPYFG